MQEERVKRGGEEKKGGQERKKREDRRERGRRNKRIGKEEKRAFAWYRLPEVWPLTSIIT